MIWALLKNKLWRHNKNALYNGSRECVQNETVLRGVGVNLITRAVFQMSRRQFFKEAKWIRLNALYKWRDSKWVVMYFLIDQEKYSIQKNKELKWLTAFLAYFCPFLNLLLYGEKSDNDNPQKRWALGVRGWLWGCQESFCLLLLLWPAANQVCNFSSWNSIQFKVS